ncbi:helix-turn-helix transcriptional regulator [Streptantibioticus silvisoli]|uniref:WYL domain-containing protein n=1 Tax=Streptantibioticus silvisoli TaxID=2705255 RepID=A0ABT6W3S5_9ACTN|nr:WYL domain-containing protein [Streptantibioticus silvisoli]MDI5965396.1 WYL domain-containing protein [Streptantibioticus silvisoli]
MTRPTARVLALLEILQAGGTRTVADLAGRLDVDERTVRRYVAHLIDLDIPVRSVRGRYGGYRLAPGYRMPPLMLTDDEALAVLLGLVAGRRAGLVTTTAAAMESAAAKMRRVLPEVLGRRLDALLATVDFTAAAGPAATRETGVLLTLAEAARRRRPVAVGYTARDGRRSERTVHPYGIVVRSGRWYVTGADSASGEVRTFRLDRVENPVVLPGSFEVPAGFDAAARVLSGLAELPYPHEVSFRVRGTAEQITARLPAGLATVEELPDAPGAVPSSQAAGAALAPEAGDEGSAPEAEAGGASSSAGAGAREGGTWVRVRLRAERLDWVPSLLARLDRPFVIEHPEALRDHVRALARRLIAGADDVPDDVGPPPWSAPAPPTPPDRP